MAGTHTALAAKTSAGTANMVDPTYRQIRDLVYKISGIFQLEEKLYLLVDACARRMKHLEIRTTGQYWEALTAHMGRENEMRQLLNEITIGETCLFRSQPQQDALRKVILPEIVSEKEKQIVKRLRIWSAGCSTGEEPYTLAMNLMEESVSLLKGWTVEILATDLNDRSVEAAKAGIYGDYALRNTSDYYRRKYFTPAGEKKLQVRPEVKQIISFSRLNLQDKSIRVRLVQRSIAEQLERRASELDRDLCLPFCQALSGTQIKRNAGPAPVVDVELQRDEGLGARFRSDSRL